jgi:long-chain acyl-CoA synthetase
MLLNEIKKEAKKKKNKIAVIDAVTHEQLTYDDINAIISSGEKYFLNNSVEVVISVGEPRLHDLIFLLSIGQVNGLWIPLSNDDLVGEIKAIFSSKNLLIIDKNSTRTRIRKQANQNHQSLFAGADPYLVTFSSGTTGLPKGVMLSQSKKLDRANQAVELFGLDDQETIISNSPIYHSLGQKNLFLSLTLGATLIRCVPFAPSTWVSACKSFSPSFGIPVSTQIQLLTEAHSEYITTFNSFRSIVLSSSAASTTLKTRLLDQKISIWDTFGCTETAFISASPITDLTSDDVGKIVGEVEVRIDNSNSEIQVSSPFLCDGYFNDAGRWANSLTPDGFFRTGDFGTLSCNKLRFHGRLGLEFLVGPYNINPMELESLIQSKIAEIECMVVPIKNEIFTNTIGLWVRETQLSVPKSDLYTRLKEDIPKHFLPTKVKYITEFPLLPSGKIDRQKLLQQMISD